MLRQDFLTKNNVGLDWLRSDTDLFETPNKNYSSWTQELYLFVQESKLNELIDEKVSRKINEFLTQRQTIQFRKVADTQAQREISKYILSEQKVGNFKVNLLELVINLKLPAEQIEKIMDVFKGKGRLEEVYE